MAGLVVAVGLGGTFTAFAFNRRPAPPGDLAVEPGEADLGRVRQNQTLAGEYAVVNRLPVAVDVDMVGKSCSCADAEVEPPHLEPGQAGVLKVAWRTGTKRGPVADRVSVIATPADGTGRKLVRDLVLKADVRPDYTVEPAELRFGTKTGGTAVLRFAPDADPDVKLVAAYAGAGGLNVSTDAAAGRVTVTCPPGLTPGNPLAVLIQTNSSMERHRQVVVVLADE